MLSLRNLQRQLAQDIFAAQGADIGHYVDPNGLTSARRVRVYRNNVFASLTDALKACYPVAERLVGEECFAYTAGSYIDAHPSRSGDLHEFGSQFPEFLRELPALVGLPYLPGVAQLEWACQEVYHAEASHPLDIVPLAAVSASDYSALRLHLNGASRLLRSNYPILRIWQVNQPGFTGDQTVDLGEGGVRLLVIQRDYAIDIKRLVTAEYEFLRAFAKGRTLAYASDRALEEDPEFDLAATLQKHVTQRTLVAFSIHPSALNA